MGNYFQKIAVVLLAFHLVLPLGFAPPEGLSTPSETIRRAEEGKKIVPKKVPTTGTKFVEVLPTPYTEEDIPKSLRNLRRVELVNDRHAADDFAQIDMSVLGPYDPEKAGISYAPYIPMPAEAFSEYLKENNMPEELSSTLFFKKDGKEYARYFIHPSKTESYDGLIKKYGIVRDEFVGFLSASPRSMYIWHPKDPSVTPFVAKTSLHYYIDDDLRINFPPKAARSYLVNDIYSKIPENVKKELGFDFMHEYAQFLPAGKATATLYRSIPKTLMDPKKTWVPGFYFSSKDGKKGPLINRLVSGKADKEGTAAEILRPLMRATAYLMYEEGIKSEPHEQNIFFELDENEQPTGKIIIKDLDGARIDAELRLRKGKSIEGLRHIFKPFIYSKFSQASGWGGGEGKSFDQKTYYDYIKETYGDSFCKAMNCTPEQKKKLYERLDEIMAEEVTRITGVAVNPKTLGAQVDGKVAGLRHVNERIRRDLNERIHKDQMDEKWMDPKTQKALKSEYLKLRKAKRASSTEGNLDSKDVYFILHGDSIEARMVDPKTFHEKSIGIASLYPEAHAQTADFRKELKKLGHTGTTSVAVTNYAGCRLFEKIR